MVGGLASQARIWPPCMPPIVAAVREALRIPRFLIQPRVSIRRSIGGDLGHGSSRFDRRQPTSPTFPAMLRVAETLAGSTKRRVRATLIVVLTPRLDLGSGVRQRQEPVGVHALVEKAAVKRPQEGVVGRLTRPTKDQRYTIFVGSPSSTSKPPRVCRRRQLLRRWSLYDSIVRPKFVLFPVLASLSTPHIIFSLCRSLFSFCI